MTSHRGKGRNAIALLTTLEGAQVSHFRLCEFENSAGLAMVHETVLTALELTRRSLCIHHGETVWILVTGAVRTQADLERLAARLGWTDAGGLVARRSRHLAEFGGIAVDIVAVVARTGVRVPQKTLGAVCRRYFDFVKDDYRDGHVHADQRGHSDG